MLKRMRRRFLLAAMASMLAVQLSIAVAVNGWNYVMTVRGLDDVIGRILEQRHGPGGRPGREIPYGMRFFIVKRSADGEAAEIYMEPPGMIPRDQAVQEGRVVLESGRPRGFLSGFRYRVFASDEGSLLIFLNCEREQDTMRIFLFISCSVVVMSLGIIWLLVNILSKRAMAPYMKSLELQKQFITDAGHELKTPVTSISASADVLEAEYGENEWTRNIKKQTGRLSRLIADLITLSRLKEEAPLPDMQEFSLSEAAWETAESFLPLAKAREKKYVQRIEEGLFLCGDRALIQQLFSLLLDNAVKYSDEGGSIELSVYKKQRRIYIEVFNTCGEDSCPEPDRLFDRFYRPDRSRSRETGESGIGLSIASSIVKAHGGKLSAVRLEKRGGILFRARL